MARVTEAIVPLASTATRDRTNSSVCDGAGHARSGWTGAAAATMNGRMDFDADAFLEDMVHVYGGGRCYELALALHETTGWPMVLLTETEVDRWDGPAYHVVVRMPDGALLDILGRDSRFSKIYPIATDLTCEDLLALVEQERIPEPCNPARAHLTARLLLTRFWPE